ncbi:hypothetical protein GCM10025793_01170 [Lysobacter lycopersici]
MAKPQVRMVDGKRKRVAMDMVGSRDDCEAATALVMRNRGPEPDMLALANHAARATSLVTGCRRRSPA